MQGAAVPERGGVIPCAPSGAPAFVTTVVLTLGVGIGANAAMFGVIDRLMVRPFPYLSDPGSVDRVYLTSVGRAVDQAYSVVAFGVLALSANTDGSFAGCRNRTG
jgi:hypothetical protein